MGELGSAWRVSEPRMLERLTMRPAGLLRMSGSRASVSATWAEEVGLEDAVEEVEGDVGGAVLGAGAGEGAAGDAGVVDQDVEAAVAWS